MSVAIKRIVVTLISVTLIVSAGITFIAVANGGFNGVDRILASYTDGLKETMGAIVKKTENAFSHNQVITKVNDRPALEHQLQIKGYNDRFLKLLNDHSLISLARKEGLPVKDWRL